MFYGNKVTAVIMAAGKGSRVNASLPKQFINLNGRSMLENAVRPFQESSHVDDILIVAGEAFEELCREKCGHFSKVKRFLTGGKERQDSVNNALWFIDEGYVLIHDGARPYVTEKVIEGVLEGVHKYGAAVPCVPVKETIRQLRASDNAKASEKTEETENTEASETEENTVESRTIDRSSLFTVQTPQGFEAGLIKRAYKKAYEEGFYGTDDASLADRLGAKVALTEGSYANIKITTREDLPVEFRAGSGYDVHRLESGRKLILCGVEIPFEKGLLGHSDADVAVHALMDAMLGAAGLGDIGRLFPDTDMKYKDISSMKLLGTVREAIEKDGWALNNADITIMAQRPKLLPYIGSMKLSVAGTLGKEPSCINIKATTTEKLGFIGREEGIAAEAVCVLIRN